MKFKGQGKINICGVEYKKNIADSRRGGGGGGVRAPRTKTCIRACHGPEHYFDNWLNELFTLYRVVRGGGVVGARLSKSVPLYAPGYMEKG